MEGSLRVVFTVDTNEVGGFCAKQTVFGLSKGAKRV